MYFQFFLVLTITLALLACEGDIQKPILKQASPDDFDEELQRRQEIRHKYFSENHDLSDIHTNHDDAC